MVSAETAGPKALVRMDRVGRGLVDQMECDRVDRDPAAQEARLDPAVRAVVVQGQAADDRVVQVSNCATIERDLIV
jgi:hypothetical protein